MFEKPVFDVTPNYVLAVIKISYFGEIKLKFVKL